MTGIPVARAARAVVEVDESGNGGLVYVRLATGEHHHTTVVAESPAPEGMFSSMVVCDFDADGNILGVEVIP